MYYLKTLAFIFFHRKALINFASSLETNKVSLVFLAWKQPFKQAGNKLRSFFKVANLAEAIVVIKSPYPKR